MSICLDTNLCQIFSGHLHSLHPVSPAVYNMNVEVNRRSIRIFAETIPINIFIACSVEQLSGFVRVVLCQIIILGIHVIIERGFEKLANTCDMTFRCWIAIGGQINDGVTIKGH